MDGVYVEGGAWESISREAVYRCDATGFTGEIILHRNGLVDRAGITGAGSRVQEISRMRPLVLCALVVVPPTFAVAPVRCAPVVI